MAKENMTAGFKGKFITFEGPEKSGKSTQALLLSEYLKKNGYQVIFIREPGSTKVGEKIRQLLLDKKNTDMTVTAEMLLYMAARAQLVEQIIEPAVKKGMIVLCDRFLDSTIAYQGFGCGLGADVIKSVGEVATQGIRPDLTLLLDFDQCRSNLKNQTILDRIEMRPDAFHQRVRKGYFQLAKKEPKRIRIIRVQQDVSATQKFIREEVQKCLLKRS